MKRIGIYSLMLACLSLTFGLSACSDDDPKVISTTGEDDYKYVGQKVGNFLAEEWYPGGELGTTENTAAGCYEDETPAIEDADLMSAFLRGEMLF